ncbi:Guanylate cyclase 2G [Blyttiomyces sp. JEL0837]|nr:Guanylate cyclase 2G [Blyttiomyces sp. JEL0837]
MTSASRRDEGNSVGNKSWKDRVNAAIKEKSISENNNIRVVYANMMVWVFMTIALTYYTLTMHRMKKFNRRYSDDFYSYASFGFLIGTVFAYLGAESARTSDKRLLSRVFLYVNGIAMITYALQVMRLTPVLTSASTGFPVDPARFLEWFSTCPTMIHMIGAITRCESIARRAMYFDYILLVCGFSASVVKEPFSYLLSTVAVICFCNLYSNLWTMFTKAIDGETDCTLDPVALRYARAATCYSWSCFPIIWFSQKAGLLSYPLGEAAFSMADVVSKVFVTLVLVNATVEESQNVKVNAISAIADEMESAMEHSDKLLSKMMPPSVLEQMKSGKATQAEEFSSVTVFFSDIANFTVLSSRTSTKDMLATLNKLWVEYDAIARRWGMYKVETIGDAYLGVIGAPERVPDHAERAVNFSIDVIEMVKTFKTITNEPIQIRVGLNSGPITAGILGEENPHWCIVGDTVNTASRMESTSKAMMIHISESTYNHVRNKPNLNISEVEVMNIKGKGTMNTYWVHGR